MRPIALVVFDLAGTTIADDSTVLHVLMDATARHDLPGSAHELNELMGMNKREVFVLLAKRKYPDDHDVAAQVAAAALQTFLHGMRAEYERTVTPIAGAEECFSFLRSRGIKVATDTGFDATVLDIVMDRLKWRGRCIDLAISSSDVPRGRPAPYMIFRAMEQLDVLDVRSVMKVGDSPVDLQEGFNAGCGEVVGVLSGAHTVATLGAMPHTRLLDSVADIPRLFTDDLEQ